LTIRSIREFLSAAARALTVQFAATTLEAVVAGAASLCESPIELAMLFALGIIGREHADSVLYDFGHDVIGNTQGSSTLPSSSRRPQSSRSMRI